jgi:hypothetical protein
MTVLKMPLRPRDSVRENNLAIELRALTRSDASRVLRELILQDSAVGLSLANRSSKDVELFRWAFERAIQLAEPSDMKYWMRPIMRRLGFRRALRLLIRYMAQYPKGVSIALYWVPQFMHGAGAKTTALLSHVLAEADTRGLLRRSNIVL